jgi:hypothetical protein
LDGRPSVVSGVGPDAERRGPEASGWIFSSIIQKIESEKMNKPQPFGRGAKGRGAGFSPSESRIQP